VGVLEGFLSTWSSARATFGVGVPQVGADFDNSAHFRRLQADVESAAPESTWGGAAADAYADANRTQGRTLGAMAELDTRLGVEVDRSAAVVATGRRDLDAVKQWVVDAASTIPRTTAGERMLWPVVSKGADEIATIIQRSHGEMSAIAERMRGLCTGYEELDKPEDQGAEPLSVGGDDEKTGDDVPETALDLADIVQLAPFDPEDPSTYGPSGYMELVPGSGTWVPDPRSRFYKPTPVQAPLDLNDIVQLAPFDPEDPSTRGPHGYMELVPGLGAWVPDPNSPTFPKDPPQAPVDLNKIVDRGSGLGMPWETELIRDSGVWVPNPNYGTPR
jgi:hypothetical protein